MPSPIVSEARAVQAFERAGWRVSRRRGSHIVLTRPATFNTLSVPDHDELDRGTLRSLIRKADLTADEFTKLLD